MAENKGLLKGFQVGFDKVNVSHLQFANDTLIYLEGEENNVKVLKSLIKCFELSFDFTVNWAKSHLSKFTNLFFSLFKIPMAVGKRMLTEPIPSERPTSV